MVFIPGSKMVTTAAAREHAWSPRPCSLPCAELQGDKWDRAGGAGPASGAFGTQGTTRSKLESLAHLKLGNRYEEHWGKELVPQGGHGRRQPGATLCPEPPKYTRSRNVQEQGPEQVGTNE